MQTIIFKDDMPKQFSIINYPDGQRSVNLYLAELDVKEPVCIKCRVKNFADLEVLLCLIAALRKCDFYIEQILFVYLFGMRSDRAFQTGECNYFRDVVAPIINKMHIPEMYVFAPHNRTILNLINAETLKPALGEELESECAIWGDESAHFLKKSIPLGELSAANYIGFFCKQRVVNNINIALRCNVDGVNEIKLMQENHRITIIDDLCDAGGTFIAEAKYLRDIGFKGKLNLFVAHGLFTKGIDVLEKYFDKITCTNSHHDINHPLVEQVKII